MINTQDVFHAARARVLIFIVLSLGLAWLSGRGQRLPPSTQRLTSREGILASVAVIALLALLGGVATGYFFAVDAAAVGAFALLCAGLVTVLC